MLIFVINFSDNEKTIKLDRNYKDIVNNAIINGEIKSLVCGYLILE